MPREGYMSSITGRFVSKEYAAENPDTTFKTELDDDVCLCGHLKRLHDEEGCRAHLTEGVCSCLGYEE